MNPITQQRYSIQSKQGQRLLKSYVKSLNTQRGGASSLDRNCEIQEPLRNGERVCKTSTGQYYHWDSLSGWLQSNNTCPITRQPIEWVREVPQNVVQNRDEVDDDELGDNLQAPPPPPPPAPLPVHHQSIC